MDGRRNSLKLFLFIIACATWSLTCAQSLKDEQVFKKDGVTKSELMLRCNQFNIFMQATYNATISVDTSQGCIFIHYSFPYNTSLFGSSYIRGCIRTTLQIFVKEGRYKTIFQQFEHIGNSKSYGIITEDKQCPRDRWEPLATEKYSTKRWDDIKATISEHILYIKTKLQSDLDQPSEKSSNW